VPTQQQSLLPGTKIPGLCSLLCMIVFSMNKEAGLKAVASSLACMTCTFSLLSNVSSNDRFQQSRAWLWSKLVWIC